MSALGEMFSFDKVWHSDMWEKIKDNPMRLLYGGMDPFSTEMWNGILGRDDEPLFNQLGGPMGSGWAGLGESAGVYDKARAKGIDTKYPAMGHNIAEIIAGSYGAAGAAGGLGNIGGAGAGGAGGAGGVGSEVLGGTAGMTATPGVLGGEGAVLGGTAGMTASPGILGGEGAVLGGTAGMGGGGFNAASLGGEGAAGGGFMSQLGDFSNWQQMLGGMQGGQQQQQQQPPPQYRGGGASSFNPALSQAPAGAQMPTNRQTAQAFAPLGLLADDDERKKMLEAMISGGMLS